MFSTCSIPFSPRTWLFVCELFRIALVIIVTVMLVSRSIVGGKDMAKSFVPSYIMHACIIAIHN